MLFEPGSDIQFMKSFYTSWYVVAHCVLAKFSFFGIFTFERIHNTKEQIYFYERAENHKAKERLFESFK